MTKTNSKKLTLEQFESMVRELVHQQLNEVRKKLSEQDGGNTSIGQKQGFGAYGPGGPRGSGIQISGQPMMDEHDFLDDRPLSNVVAMETRKAWAALEQKLGGKVSKEAALRLAKLLVKKYPEYQDVIVDRIHDLLYGEI